MHGDRTLTRTENLPPIAIERQDTVDSTSARARRLVDSGGFGDRPRLFVALEQTEGVGRFGRVWASPIGGLWMTLGWPVTVTAAEVLDGLGLRIGLELLHAIDHTLAGHGHDSDVRIKWPNDILIGGRKVAGVLCETIRIDATTHILVGVGINGNFPIDALPEELRTTATTLLDEIGGCVDLDRLLEDLVDRLACALTAHGITGGAIEEIERRLHGVGETASVTLPDRTTLTGTLLGLTRDGRLRLQTGDGEISLPSGAELAPNC